MPVQFLRQTIDNYDPALTIDGQLLKQVSFSVSSPNSAKFQIAKLNKTGQVVYDLDDLVAQPGAGAYTDIYGIRFKSFTPGIPTTVLCQAYFEDDPTPVGFTPSDAAFTAGSGTVTPGGLVGVITGRINGDGTIASGTGFTINHIGTGQWRIIFTTAFASIPTVLCTPAGGGANLIVNTDPSTQTTLVCYVYMRTDAGGAADFPWTFVAFPTA